MRNIELLSPAKNIECGLAAINHGADAVYIGASRFGARAAATNCIQDLERLAAYAHKYNAHVYAAVNIILRDEELEEAQKLARQLYDAGIDALIVQDLAFLSLDIPPIPLHASTQIDNRTVEKVQFLEQAGYSQVVLARELELAQIKEIADKTSVPLEVFVHGALCVSYSGQCYMSQSLFGRSANHGECAQCCRLPYDLVDSEGNILSRQKHLLSLKDMNLSAYLKELIDAGVSSFKIEGRLKDADYVKNITAYYRERLDNILEGRAECRKASSGKTSLHFIPNYEKSFHRGSTDYFLHGRKDDITSFDTPKSIGERVGKVIATSRSIIEIDTDTELHNGDGLCFIAPNSEYSGFRINRMDGRYKINVTQMPPVKTGTVLFRNLDNEFQRLLSNENSAERKISVTFTLSESSEGFLLAAEDEDRNQVQTLLDEEKQTANNPQKATENILAQLGKLGNTDFEVKDIHINLSSAFFIPNSHLADARRKVIDLLTQMRRQNYKRLLRLASKADCRFPASAITYLGNVHNNTAKSYLLSHGAASVSPSFESQQPEGVPLMFTKHCLRYSLGACPKHSPKPTKTFSEPLHLQYKDKRFRLQFDCAKCEMQIIADK